MRCATKAIRDEAAAEFRARLAAGLSPHPNDPGMVLTPGEYAGAICILDANLSPEETAAYQALRHAAYANNAAERERRDQETKAKIVAAAAEREAGIARRAGLALADLTTELGLDHLVVLALLSDDGEDVTVQVEGLNGHRARRVNLASKVVTKLALIGGAVYDLRTYKYADGVLVISTKLDRPWAAVVADPSAAKPVYRFLDRCPGGWVAPTVTPGDVIVWGGTGGSRRRPSKERHDRLVYAVDDDWIYCACVDYATARRIRKSLI